MQCKSVGKPFDMAYDVEERFSEKSVMFGDDLKIALVHLEDKAFQITRLGHGSQHGMVAGLGTAFDQLQLPLRVSGGIKYRVPQTLLAHMIRTRTRGQESLGANQSKRL